MNFFAEFQRGKTGIDGVVEFRLKLSANYSATEAPTLEEFCSKQKARVLTIVPGPAGSSSTVMICFESLP